SPDRSIMGGLFTKCVEEPSDERARFFGRHHPHVPEVRPSTFSKPDGAAPGHGFPRVRTLAVLRQYAPPHRGRAGPRDPDRSEPNSWIGPEPCGTHGDSARAEAQDPGYL